jgi:hypothetical protein
MLMMTLLCVASASSAEDDSGRGEVLRAEQAARAVGAGESNPKAKTWNKKVAADIVAMALKHQADGRAQSAQRCGRHALRVIERGISLCGPDSDEAAEMAALRLELIDKVFGGEAPGGRFDSGPMPDESVSP